MPGFEEMDPPPSDYDLYLTYMNMNMYLLNAKTPNAFWIPDGAKTADRQHYPWCLTWDVISYKNMGTYMLEVGVSEEHKTVGGALQANSGSTNTEIKISTSVTEKQELLISAGMSVMVKGAASTLDGHGNPTVTVTTIGLTVEEGASLDLENLIIDAENTDPIIFNSGNLSIINCRILGDEKGDGVVLDGGTLYMEKTYLSKSGGDGIRVQKGYASLVNCSLTGNAWNGLHNENGTVMLEHCTLLQNGKSDFSTGAAAVSEATNTVMGSIAPDSEITRLSNCLIETLPDSVAIEEQKDCLLNMTSGYVVENGELTGILPDSRCVDAGTASANADDDIDGIYRDQQSDIGALEYYQLMEIKCIDTMELTTMDTDPQTVTDALQLVLDIKVPTGFTLMEEARYTITFGNHLVSSDQFDSSSKSDDGLEFSMSSGNSTLQMALSSDQKRLKMSLNLSAAQLYQDISQYVMNSRDDESNSNISTVYMPIQAVAGNYQTGEVWMSFKYEAKEGVNTGSEPRLVSSGSSCSDDDDDTCDDASCFISTLN